MELSIADLYRGQIGGVGSAQEKPAVKEPKLTPGAPSQFHQILDKEKLKDKFQLSQHAETRIKSREIPWTPELENRIASGLNQAESKGSREALILAGDVAVIANVKSRTIVTAMDRGQMKDRIFTNIDSAVLV